MSPSQCVRINYSDLKTLPGSKPICVSGTLGKGRYIVVGGPHAFESSTHGFFSHNSHFVDNIINWLFGNPKQT